MVHLMDLQVEALYFQARENGYSYAIVEDRVTAPDFKSHFGARIQLASEFGCDCWRFRLSFLHYHARNRSSISGKVQPLWGHPGTFQGPFVQRADSMWRLHMGFGDLDLGRSWPISSCVTLTPYIGLRFASVRHKADVDYLTFSTFSMKNKFWGIGPLIGVETKWLLGGNFSLYAQVSGSLLFGELYVHQDQKWETNALKFFDIFTQTRAILGGELGLEQSILFSCWTLSLRVGGNLYWLPGQNQLPYFTSSEMEGKFVNNLGDLSLTGLSFGLGLEF